MKAKVRTARIYGLVDPTTGKLMFVGATREREVYDLYRHVLHARHFGRLVDGWLHSLAMRGTIPGIILFEDLKHERWTEALSFWREYYTGLGAELLPNGTGPAGGRPERPRELMVGLSVKL